MPGTPGRSGRPSKGRKNTPANDGPPSPPRPLSHKAQKHFDWLISCIDATDTASPWRRIDGIVLGQLAELIESSEAVANGLKGDPCNDKLLRMRIQYADRIFKYSGLVGLSPRDRERVPQTGNVPDDDADEWSD